MSGIFHTYILNSYHTLHTMSNPAEQMRERQLLKSKIIIQLYSGRAGFSWERRQGIGCMVRGGKIQGARGRDELMGGCPLLLTLN